MSRVLSFIEPGTALDGGATSMNKIDLGSLLMKLKTHREMEQYISTIQCVGCYVNDQGAFRMLIQ